jgi:RsiW-degrading membrane proteinase PrsW (M82 family)
MTLTIIASGIVAPALLWIGYFYYKDQYQPEPPTYILFTYLLGLVSAFVCFKAYGLLPYIGLPDDASALMEVHGLKFLVYSLGIVGILEESFKFLPFLVVVLRFKSFDEKVDGIVYASVIALGFASFENFHYLAHLDGFEQIGRAVASPLTHTIFSSIWGYMVGIAYMTGRSLWKASFKGLVLAALCHGIFDFLTTSPTLRITSALIILLIWLWRIKVMERLVTEHKNNDKIEKEKKETPKV